MTTPPATPQQVASAITGVGCFIMAVGFIILAGLCLSVLL